MQTPEVNYHATYRTYGQLKRAPQKIWGGGKYSWFRFSPINTHSDHGKAVSGYFLYNHSAVVPKQLSGTLVAGPANVSVDLLQGYTSSIMLQHQLPEDTPAYRMSYRSIHLHEEVARLIQRPQDLVHTMSRREKEVQPCVHVW